LVSAVGSKMLILNSSLLSDSRLGAAQTIEHQQFT
jgi:hypothetical protein